MVGWLAAVGVLAALAALFPWELGRQGRSLLLRAGRHPAGVVLRLDVPEPQVPAGPHAGIRARCCVVFFGILGAVLVLVPFLDRKGARRRHQGGIGSPSSPRRGARPDGPRPDAPSRSRDREAAAALGLAGVDRRLGARGHASSQTREGRRSDSCISCHLALDDARSSPRSSPDDIHARTGFLRRLPWRRSARPRPGRGARFQEGFSWQAITS